MGILEIHFHDSEFSWTVNPRESDGKTLSFGSGESESSGSRSATETGDSPGAQKLWTLAALALFVGLGIGFSKLRDRGGTETADAEPESSGRRLSLSRSK